MAQRKSAVALGMTVILAGLLTLAGKIVAFAADHLPQASSGFAGWPSVQAVYMWLALSVMLGVRFWLWGHARGGKAAPWLLAAAIAGVLAAVASSVFPLLAAAGMPLADIGWSWSTIFSATSWGSLVCHVGALLLLGIGLARWERVPKWIGWTLLGAGVLSATGMSMLEARLPGADVVSEIFGWMEAVALLGLGTALLVSSLAVQGYARRLAVAGAVALTLFAASTALAGYAGAQHNADTRSWEQRSQALPRTFGGPA